MSGPTMIKLAALLSAMSVIFAIVKALKSDTPIPWTVPPKWRPLLAIVLGQIGVALCALAKMKFPNIPLSYGEIFGIGVAGSSGSSLLNGIVEMFKAPPAPLLVKSVKPPPVDAAPVDVPKPPPLPPGLGGALAAFLVAMGVVFGGAHLVSACTPAKTAAAEKTYIDTEKCITDQLEANPQADPKMVALTCGLEDIPDVISLIMARKAMLAAKRKCDQPIVFTVDAGVVSGPGR